MLQAKGSKNLAKLQCRGRACRWEFPCPNNPDLQDLKFDQRQRRRCTGIRSCHWNPAMRCQRNAMTILLSSTISIYTMLDMISISTLGPCSLKERWANRTCCALWMFPNSRNHKMLGPWEACIQHILLALLWSSRNRRWRHSIPAGKMATCQTLGPVAG